MSSQRRRIEGALGHPLSDQQWTAISAPLEPAVIVAGAGSGKTTVMAARVLWAVTSGLLPPEQVLGLTFTTKAAAELLGRTRRFLAATDLDEAAGDPTISTYHAFAASLVNDHGIRLGLEPAGAVLADGARHELASRVVATSAEPLWTLDRRPATVVVDLLALDDRLAELDVEPATVRADAERLIADLSAREADRGLQRIGRDMLVAAQRRALLAGLVGEFRLAKADRGLVDFADQIRLALTLARSSPQVVADVRERFGLVLLDEYQDTSVAQRRLLQVLVGDGHPVTAVGDPCQAIYEWRGASVDNIDRFPWHFPVAGEPTRPASRYPLSDNRRSAPAILELANEIAQPLRAQHSGVQALTPAALDRGPGRVRCALLPTIDDEISWVADLIADLGAGSGWRDIAVLARTAQPLARLEVILRRRGIPVHLANAAPLLTHPIVAAVRDHLDLLSDPGDDAAATSLLTGPLWRLSPLDLAALARFAARAQGRHAVVQEPNPDPLWAAIDGSDGVDRVSLLELARTWGRSDRPAGLSGAAAERLAEFGALMRELAGHVDEPVVDLIGRILRASGLDAQALIGDPLDVDLAGRALSAFRGLAAESPGRQGRVGLASFLARLRTAEEFDAAPSLDPPTPADAVALMTVHRAKGLEFGHVVVMGMSATVFPSTRARPRWPTAESVLPWHLRDDAPSALLGFPDPHAGPRAKDYDAFVAASRDLEAAEERRLAYVAITRAERSVTLTGHGWGGTQVKPRGPGEYLLEALEWARSGGGEVVTWIDAPEVNPLQEQAERGTPWPSPPDEAQVAVLRAAGQQVESAPPVLPERWRVTGEALVAEARRREQAVVQVPARQWSATDLVRLDADPAAWLEALRRPMPRAMGAGAARGVRFHEWVQRRFGALPLLDIEDLPGSADADVDDDLAALQQAFEAGRYADQQPLAVEAPFVISVAGRVVRGRIDAVFRDDQGRPEVVDWKTGRRTGLSDVQLAVYRLAWARMHRLDPADVSAAFVLVTTGEVVRPTDLPGPERLAELLALAD